VLKVPTEVLRDRADAWFPFGAHLIAGLYRTARSVESTARQHSSLVTLGTLAAGLAHEINNPAAAASRAVDALETETQTLLSSVHQLTQQDISPEQFEALDALRSELAPPDLDPLARADQEQAIATWLNRHGVARAWIIAAQLTAAGVDLAWCARAAAILEGPVLEPGLEWIARTYAVETLLSELKESTRRISELIAAVRSYTQMDRASLQRIDVTDGLDSTLVMLGHQLRGVTVVRDYGTDVPMIDSYAGELNQVWTNLIDNAIDALGEQGTITITTSREAGGARVDVTDDGPGIPPEIRDRVFDSFFTTKEVGHGIGLGLATAHRIVVDRHRGTLTVSSDPSATSFHVWLPLTQTDGGAGG
jgi:signal transduction histidine kinase